ncbi:putative neural-cadherin 2 isoform X1 [Homarus americanus]|nr:putative neural-cadherin 2 isoform X1 [Homarus americanus]
MFAPLSTPTPTPTPTTASRVWLVSPGVTNLHHIILYRKEELSAVLGMAVRDVGVGTCHEIVPITTQEDTGAAHGTSSRTARRTARQAAYSCKDGCWVRAALGEGFSVVDAHTSAVVGPRVEVLTTCGCGNTAPAHHTICTPYTCLNGGRCVPTSTGTRCICPHNTWGSRCKVVIRHFEGGGGGWAWVPPIPHCTEVHLSMEVLTRSGAATLLYSGSDQGAAGAVSDLLLLELRQGRPSLLLDLGGGPVTLVLNASYSLADNTWHRIDLIWKDQLVEMIVDLCTGGSLNEPPILPANPAHNHSASSILPDAHTCRGAARLPQGTRVLNAGGPLQVGGLAHPPSAHILQGNPSSPRPPHFHGCIRNLRVNSQLVDLGSEVLSRASSPGCVAADCLSSGLYCGLHGRCQGSPGSLRCECQPGWSGPGCATPTTPTTFLLNSYVKLALSFTLLGYTTSISLRFRTWRRRGQLVALASQHGRDSWSVEVMGGRLCVVLHLHPRPQTSLCLSRASLTDGRWHSLTAARYGSATFLTVDDGDGDLYNASVVLEGRQMLEVDGQEGVHVGGTPEYAGVTVFNIHRDYHDGCMDDLRISGRGVPLSPAVNSTAWGQASVLKGVEQGCGAPPACANVSCRTPLTCVDTWRSYHCGCGEGRVLTSSQTSCDDEDECVWQPCLNGGSCFNTQPGYVCACPAGFSGQHCHLPDVGETSLKLSLAALVAIVVWCTFLLLLICAFLLHQHHRRSALRRGAPNDKDDTVTCKEQVSPPCSHTPNLLELQLLKPPRANGQPAWTKNPNIAAVDVLQVDNASVTSSMEDQKRCNASPAAPHIKHKGDKDGGTLEAEKKNGVSKGQVCSPPAGDDLRNYAYEGDGSSPGSLSSCKSSWGSSTGLESCSGSAKFLGGFREVAHMLES